MLGRMGEQTLAAWNSLPPEAAAQAILPSCGSHAWSWKVAARRPVENADELEAIAAEVWLSLDAPDWEQAFAAHPRIGEASAAADAGAQSLAWSAEEQRAALAGPEDGALAALADANRRYEQRFGRLFLICASGKSSAEILSQLELRLPNDAAIERQTAAREQQKIMLLRLRRWLRQGMA